MADRRMFAQKIIDSDAFLDMPLSSQALYFHLSMRADDDGFVSKPKSIQRLVKAADDDMRILVSKRYILAFDTGIIVIKHWKIHNYIRADRKTDTIYEEEKSLLSEKENGSYTEADGNRMVPICTGKEDMSTMCQPYDNQLSTKCQHRLGKVSIGKDSISNTLCRDHSDEIEQVIAYLNDKSHSKFSAKTAETKKLLSGRFSDRYTAEDMQHVIDLKCEQWLTDVKMRQYIRPSTLFLPSKFESYLNEYNRTHTDEQQECKSEVKNNTNSPHIAIPEDCR